MFWGLIMEPNKRYTQVVEKPFHISQAAMDISTGDNDPCQVMVVVDGKNFLVCTLQKGKIIQVPLDLYFKSGDAVSFLTNGKCNVHLTGYLDPEFEEDLEDEEDAEEEEEEEEAPPLVPAKNKRKLENANDATANKKAKPDKKAGKNTAPAAESDSDDDDEDQLQKFLDGEDIDTDENDESFKMNTSAEGDDSDEEDDDEEEEDEDDEEEDDEEEAEEAPKKKKKQPAAEQDSTLDTSKESVDMSKLSKSQKRRLKKKLQQQAKQQPQVNGVDKPKKEEPQQKAEKKKPEAKKEEAPAEKKEKKQIAGGVSIEDLKVGSGPVAKAGKVVMVYYEGRLKQNNKMFDNCVKGPGFKFRLGSKEVISGWDVGIAGMKVGGKRKIVCPPAMAYGAKGSPPVIPPNSTLVFEVELKNVK
ncbi:46 kDa FK506-binding nuclear protein [Spodoptera litura]|uniref:FK506-binding protein n=1 Tax=Spodoptera litura TaxID=69820 RepID=A0A9J7ITI1_SPOLT|nr:46 kDa FK506-binding nuclear protein [Spodoptera litura]